MEPPLRERLGWRTSVRQRVAAPADGAAMAARRLLVRGSAGRWCAVLALVLPHAPELDERGLARRRRLAAAAGRCVALIGCDRCPRWAFHVGRRGRQRRGHGGDLLLGRGARSIGPLPYLWPALYAVLVLPGPRRRWCTWR